jgi:hypothetical protein
MRTHLRGFIEPKGGRTSNFQTIESGGAPTMRRWHVTGQEMTVREMSEVTVGTVVPVTNPATAHIVPTTELSTSSADPSATRARSMSVL